MDLAENKVLNRGKRKSSKASNNLKKHANESKSCVICIGSTGSGKSSTIKKCLQRDDVMTGDGVDRVNNECRRYSVEVQYEIDQWKSLQDLVWVDTVGWNDKNRDDNDTFKDILMFINDHNLHQVKAIIWNINPNIREDDLITRQAYLINLFKEEEIWKNVIIICKKSQNPDKDAAGAIAAAKKHIKRSSNPKVASVFCQKIVVGYTFLNDPIMTESQRELYKRDESIRKLFLVKHDEEVREKILNILIDPQFTKDVKVILLNQKCKDCGVQGDARLMPKHCHMQSIQKHPGNLTRYHPKGLERYHEKGTYLDHVKGVSKPWYTSDFVCCKFGSERYRCCGAEPGAKGCKTYRSCCKIEYNHRDELKSGCLERYICCQASFPNSKGCDDRYSCCGNAIDSHGCLKVCKNCDRKWGTNADGCFEKKHNVEDINHLDNSDIHA